MSLSIVTVHSLVSLSSVTILCYSWAMAHDHNSSPECTAYFIRVWTRWSGEFLEWSTNWSIYFPSFWLPLAFSGQFGSVVVNSEDFIAAASTTASVSSSTKYKVSHFDEIFPGNLVQKVGNIIFWYVTEIANGNQSINLYQLFLFRPFSKLWQTLRRFWRIFDSSECGVGEGGQRTKQHCQQAFVKTCQVSSIMTFSQKLANLCWKPF